MMLWFFGGLAVAPARAHAQAGRTHDWSLSTRASAEADYAAGSDSQAALGARLDGEVRRDRLPFRGATGGALWLAAGGAAPGLGATHWSRLRLWGLEYADDTVQVSFGALDARHRLDWHGKPELSSSRTLWRRPFTSWSMGASMHMLALGSASMTFTLAGVGFDLGQVIQHDGALTAVQAQGATELVFMGVRGRRAHGPDFVLDILAGGARGGGRDTWTSVGSIDFVRLQGMRFADTVYADFSIAVAGTNVMPMGVPEDGETPGGAPDAMPDTATEDEAPLGYLTAVRGRVQGTRGPVTVAVAGHRDVLLTFDGEAALEHRLASEVSWVGREHAVTVEAFAAHTELWPDVDQRERDVTGGVSGTWQRALDHGWFLDLSVEAARSFYASLAGAAQPEAGLGARATAQLSRRFGTLP